MMSLPREYIDDLLVRIAYHSSAIEGNTISLADTVTILLHETIPGKVSKREFYEIENHKQALEYVIKQLENNEPLSLNIVRGIHEQLMDHLNFDRGMWKTHDNAIVGADFNTASAHDVPYLMKQWVDNLNYRLEQSKTDEEKIKHILEMHIDFERIHPFSDGNGRTRRLLIIYSLLEHDISPIIIPVDLKSDYIRFLAKKDSEGLYNLLYPIILEESKRIKAFENKEKTSIGSDDIE
ncbi:Fic family protein [Acetoanaerobium pronyense]|uniref:Fic family protein n=1 Tax=Acetoanaerobium pronyense TaxID=1482736 RepID=A0ABS4KLH0_9FIRM|nr:Fic family protein [Acetoanaerobium pronyense]MBP2028616.1 Fic family protein [Acetoanaerobium pronyense]